MNPQEPSTIRKTLDEIMASYAEKSGTNFIDERRLPDFAAIQMITDLLLEVLFPGCSGKRDITRDNVMYVIGDLLNTLRQELNQQIYLAYRHECRLLSCTDPSCENKSIHDVDYLLSQLPAVRAILKEDVRAAYAGDPAASSEEEVVISYPGIKALAIHRVAHELQRRRVPLIPRMMSELSHSHTGIDIHPGAQIGPGLFIDHGTGVVIGETTIIGEGVKIFQGVTLGALSFPKDACGNLIRGQKRHPTIEDNVTIYAHATILGDITIGKNSLIGSNVWLKQDVTENTMVLMEDPKMVFRSVKK